MVILRPTFLVQDKMFRKFLKKILKNLNSLKKSLKLFKIPIFKDNSLKVRALFHFPLSKRSGPLISGQDLSEGDLQILKIKKKNF